jgi:hypothetical protein
MPEAPSTLTIVPAGAGSGKTFFLQQELTARIKAGLAPEKIVARRARDTARTLTVLDGAREYRARPLDNCRVVVEKVWDRFTPAAGQRVDTVTHDSVCRHARGRGLQCRCCRNP